MFKPLRSQAGDTVYHVNKIYAIEGTHSNLFEKTAHIIAEKISSDKFGAYKRVKNTYSDGAPNKKIRVDQDKLEAMAAEDLLDILSIKYRKDLNDRIIIDGDLDISELGLKKLPNLTDVTVNGNFICSQNKLTSLIESPRNVQGFYCDGNELTSLEGSTIKVTHFHCYDNCLINLASVLKDIVSLESDFGDFTSYEDIPKELLAIKQTTSIKRLSPKK